MYGIDIFKSLSVTMGRFLMTYVDDAKWFFKGGFGSGIVAKNS